ncbi:MAG: hypothetical protein VYB40_00015 [Candidatus Thermoplasmatota archaeon]|nr:hypothetical protein [Candidatus Thermoplasmatota archaeon]
MGDSPRLILGAPRTRDRTGLAMVLILVLPLLSPLAAVEAAQIKAEDFGIIAELNEVLDARDEMLDSNQITLQAENALSPVRNGVRSLGSEDALTQIDVALDGLQIESTAPEEPNHPKPVDILTSQNDVTQDVFVTSVFSTILELTEYVIWTDYRAINDGPTYQNHQKVDFSSNLLSLFSQDPLMHDIDIDGNGVDDIRVGITISFQPTPGNGWGLSGSPPTQLWIEPTIEYRVEVIDINNPLWNQMESLEVSLIKAFAYGINLGGILDEGGESYLWLIDSHFTIPPTDWALQVGFERFWFDISNAGTELISALVLLASGITSGGGVNADDTGVTIAALSAPISIQIDNGGQTDCPSHYEPNAHHFNQSWQHDCRVGIGFGYAHFAPEENNARELWELEYLEVGVHPESTEYSLPSIVDLTIRTDNVLPTGSGNIGEDGLTTIEYYADERADLWLHFYENKSNYRESASEPYGNVSETLVWLRGMPSGTLSPLEIERCFQMLGSASQPELPGQLPTRLSLILGIKNFTRDSTPNVDDPTLPINPQNPPNTLVLLRSTQSVSSLEYVSWFLREGVETDHRMTRIDAAALPTGLVLYGDFWLGGSEEQEIGNADNSLDIFSRLLDTTILTVVDIFIEISNVINSIPNALVDVISGSTGSASQGTAIHLEMFNHFEVGRQPMPVGSLSLVMGSSDVPVGLGPHMLLADDKSTTEVQGRNGSNSKLVPIALSLHHEGLHSLHIVDDAQAETQRLEFGANGGGPLRILFLEHTDDENGAIDIPTSDFQYVFISDHPASLVVDVSAQELVFNSDRDIPEVVYAGREGQQRQVLDIDTMPGNFTMKIGDDVSWLSQSPIGSISLMISNATDPKTMDGDHFLFMQDLDAGEATLSTRVHGITEVGFLGAEEPGAPGEAGRGTGFLVGPGDSPFRAVIVDETEHESPADGITAHVLIDPLPANLSLEVPQGGVGDDDSLNVPEFTKDEGLAGIAFFLAGFTDFGESVNAMLGEMVTSVTGGAIEDQRTDFSFGVELQATENFDLVVDARQGRMPLEEPEWLHGISMEADLSADNHTAFHARIWLPDLAPHIDLSVDYQNLSVTDRWEIGIELNGWVPANPEFMIEVNNYNGRDLNFLMLGFQPGQATDIKVEAEITTDYRPVVPQLTMFSNYQMSVALDAIHAVVLDRNEWARYELLLQGIPKELDMTASLGSVITVGMEADDSENTGLSLDSLMLEMKRFNDGKWWPATVFLHELPAQMNLTTAPSEIFDITQPISFQGMATLIFSSSSPGMDLFISTTGRSVDVRGDSLLLADNLASHMSIEPTEDFGLRITSSGEGIGRLYLRQSDVPAEPGIWIDQLEAAGENLKSATIHMTFVGYSYYTYPVVKVEDVRGGRIIANARAYVDVSTVSEYYGTPIDAGNLTLDGRAVLIDAQVTGGIPSGTTIGVNGLASDLSILNMMGVEASTTHYLIPEPLTSGLLTIFATVTG